MQTVCLDHTINTLRIGPITHLALARWTRGRRIRAPLKSADCVDDLFETGKKDLDYENWALISITFAERVTVSGSSSS